jgi:hypothetical protein
MPIAAWSLAPIAGPRRRPNHRSRRAAHRGQLPAAPPAAAGSPARALATLALATLRRARRPAIRPEPWLTPRFGREVELVRSHLSPIRGRAVLAASFGREAFHFDAGRGDADPAGMALGPVTVAYAIRWLELGDREPRPRWDVWLAESAPRPSEPLVSRRATRD